MLFAVTMFFNIIHIFLIIFHITHITVKWKGVSQVLKPNTNFNFAEFYIGKWFGK